MNEPALAPADPSTLARRFEAVRAATLALIAPLEPEDMQVQSMPDVSPTKWHLGHTTWFFETFVLEPRPEHRAFHLRFREIFNSYYQQVGERHPRPDRGLLTRPRLREVLEYREHVESQLAEILHRDPASLGERALSLVELGLHHEQQHQELMLMDIKHVLGSNPLDPRYRPERAPDAGTAAPLHWHRVEGGLVEIGHDGRDFGYDNEFPRHRTWIEDIEIASRPVTNRELLEFVEDGGYQEPTLWLADAWDHMQNDDPWSCPMYWERRDGQWMQFTLHGLEPLRLDEPATHLSYYEADAFARWTGYRLPTEAEWENTARDLGVTGNFVENGQWHPRAYAGDPADAEQGPVQMFGDVWEWTQSHYSPYPGFRAPAGAVGEYNGKFMANQFVLRGGCWATPQDHVRATYRNFFHPWTRWHFGGVRLVRDV